MTIKGTIFLGAKVVLSYIYQVWHLARMNRFRQVKKLQILLKNTIRMRRRQHIKYPKIYMVEYEKKTPMFSTHRSFSYFLKF